jgi:hypothetical protein
VEREDRDEELLDLSPEEVAAPEPGRPPEIIEIDHADLEEVEPASPSARLPPPKPLSGPIEPAGFAPWPPGKKRTLADAAATVVLNLFPMALAGALGGLLAWGLLEPFIVDNPEARESLSQVLRAMAGFGAVTGGAVGMAIGAVEGLTAAHWPRLLRGAGLGLVLGAGCGAFSSVFGQILYGTMGGGEGLPLLVQVLVRAVAWAAVGAGVGLAPGLAARARRKLVNGLVGGLVGGGIGGFVFDILALIVGGGEVSRLVGMTTLGLAAGAAIGIVEEVRKEAWLIITAGPARGKQFILYNPITTIGRSYEADIPLLKEPGAAPIHCRLSRRGGQFVLEDLSGGRTLLDGRPVTDQPLRSGQIITIGGTSLAFYERLLPTGPAAPGSPGRR